MNCGGQTSLTCSPETDPATRRVRRPETGRWRILDEEEAYPTADRAQVARGGRRAGCGSLDPRSSSQEARHQRGYMPPLEESVRRDESSSEAKSLKELEEENARLKKLVAEQALDIDILKEVSRKNF